MTKILNSMTEDFKRGKLLFYAATIHITGRAVKSHKGRMYLASIKVERGVDFNGEENISTV